MYNEFSNPHNRRLNHHLQLWLDGNSVSPHVDLKDDERDGKGADTGDVEGGPDGVELWERSAFDYGPRICFSFSPSPSICVACNC